MPQPDNVRRREEIQVIMVLFPTLTLRSEYFEQDNRTLRARPNLMDGEGINLYRAVGRESNWPLPGHDLGASCQQVKALDRVDMVVDRGDRVWRQVLQQ